MLGTLMLSLGSCTDDLNTTPTTQLSLEELLAQDPNAIEGIVSRLYGSFALSGPNGVGSSDISDDPGESPFLRGIINLQDFTADGMKNRWGDDGLDQLTTATDWDGNNKFFRYVFNRIYYTIPQCNNLLQVLEQVNVENKEIIRSETRFVRALAYFYLIDSYGKGVLATEDNLGQVAPLPESTRQELFDFVEAELLEIVPILPETNSYGRANTYVASMLLANLYINAGVYTGTTRYDDAAIYVNKVLTGGYSLDPNFVKVFSADNFESPEIIFPLIADSQVSQSYGNTTYIVNGNLSPDTITLSDFGATEGWQGHRATKAWYGLFASDEEGLEASNDVRASLFWTQGHNFEMNDYRTWTDGYPSIKFRNTEFQQASTPTAFSSTDFPLYRLADTYLMYAELAVRGASGTDMNTALTYVNQIRTRANATTVAVSALTEQFILDERARELNLEGHRRTDLIRFGKFTGGSYLWPWKGGIESGTSIPDTYRLFPIPNQALQANPNLQQNPGY